MKIYKAIKRILDAVCSFVLIICASPLFIIFSVLCAVDTKASPLFLQERVGKNSRIFKIVKFRTMKKSAPSTIPARDIENREEYVSGLGEWLRKTGFDELPQLFNIFIGQMSFVGPRPLMTSETVLHRKREKLGVYSVRPGMTGPAQLECESINSVDEKAALDYKYVTKMGFFYDLKLIFLTFARFFRGKHIDEHFTSPSDEKPSAVDR